MAFLSNRNQQKPQNREAPNQNEIMADYSDDDLLGNKALIFGNDSLKKATAISSIYEAASRNQNNIFSQKKYTRTAVTNGDHQEATVTT